MNPDPQKFAVRKAWQHEISAAEALLIAGDLEGAQLHAASAERLAEEICEPPVLQRTGRALLSLFEWGRSARLFAIAERLNQPDGLQEWDGRPFDGTLLIAERSEDIGRPIRHARLIPLAAKRAKRCIVLAEPRLVPLFRRSFPNVDVRSIVTDGATAAAEADIVAGYNTLIQHLAPDDESVRASFRSLCPDQNRVHEIKERYAKYPTPLIGISWHSIKTFKETPSVPEWAGFMRAFPGSFVSLQYGDVSETIRAFEAQSGRAVIHDVAIDPLRDMDLFAAQVAAMDAIVTISNTAVHVAGALGVRTFLVIDDTLRFAWPLHEETTPWYPSTTVIRRKGRDWPAVFDDVRSRLTDFLAQRDPA